MREEGGSLALPPLTCACLPLAVPPLTVHAGHVAAPQSSPVTLGSSSQVGSSSLSLCMQDMWLLLSPCLSLCGSSSQVDWLGRSSQSPWAVAASPGNSSQVGRSSLSP